MEFSITLPVALWICLPAVCLFVLALLFMGFASLVQKFKSMTLHRDIEKIFTQIQEQMLGNPVRERVFKHRVKDAFKDFAEIYFIARYKIT